ncbi:interferon-inducible double-stranded RNA-dependent protein kinase activator A homolog [Diabrotica undecimpunctata]|uniref:interferon-inducible double-stranded RNA-dependent protein kinase activator A homolog n=1 Tax=Diabrotica undecimpunctata TaxID=50387 RepID=UPI003B6323C6
MMKSPISLLEERFVRSKPVYIYEDPARQGYGFTCTIKVGGITAHGSAFTKKEAKQKAAEEALILLGNYTKTTTIVNTPLDVTNYISILNEHAQKNRLSSPIYIEKPVHGQYEIECCYAGLTGIGTGTNKKIAKQLAAKSTYERLDSANVNALSSRLNNSLVLDDPSYKQKILYVYDGIKKEEESKCQAIESEIIFPKFQVEVKEEDVLEKLKLAGHKYNPVVLHTNPFILALQIGDRATVLGRGDTRKEAEKDLLAEADLIFFSEI